MLNTNYQTCQFFNNCDKQPFKKIPGILGTEVGFGLTDPLREVKM